MPVAEKARLVSDSPPPAPSFWNPATVNLAAALAGMTAGWFLGPRALVLKPLASAFVNLLTMLSVPFLVLALVHGLGRLSPSRLAALGRVGAASLGGIWTISFAACWAVSALFPLVGNASFYSDPSAAQAELPGLMSLLIPANPFHALANGVVPAVVFFCLMFAWQLAHVEGKDRLLDWLGVSLDVLIGMAGVVNRLLPLASFVLSIAAFGGINAALVSQVRVFVLAVIVVTVVLGFVLLPAIVGVVTPVGGMQVVRGSLPAALTAFLTGSAFAALPQIIGAAQSLLERDTPADPATVDAERDEQAAEASTIIPLAVNFPTAGSMLTLLFVMFAASSFDRPLTPFGQLKLAVVGTIVLFSGNTLAIGFLCALARLPAEATVVFAGLGAVVERFRSVLSAMSLIALSTVTHHGVHGQLRVSALRVGFVLAAILAPLYLACQAASGMLVLPAPIKDYYRTHSVALSPSIVVRKDSDEAVQPTTRPFMTRLREGRPLRAGVQVERPPFTYRNEAGHLSGYSVALARLLADDLGGRLELVEVEPAQLLRDLEEGRIDILLSPVQVDAERLRTLAFATGFGVVRPAVVYRDERRSEVESRLGHDDWAGFTVGVRRGTHLSQRAPTLMPGARIETVDSPDELVTRTDLDGLLWNDLEATAWSVTNPTCDQRLLPRAAPILLGYPLRASDVELAGFMRTWLEMQKTRGTLDLLYRDWMLGKSPEAKGAPVDQLLEWMVGH